MAPGISVLTVSARALIFTSVLMSKMRLKAQGEENKQEMMNAKPYPLYAFPFNGLPETLFAVG